MKFNIGEIVSRSPRLETIIMIEKFIKENSGEMKKTEIFNNLPKRVMWGTFNVILKYLYENKKIIMDKEGYIVYTWDELMEKVKNRKIY